MTTFKCELEFQREGEFRQRPKTRSTCVQAKSLTGTEEFGQLGGSDGIPRACVWAGDATTSL